MVVLHASCLSGEFLLWGEAARETPQVGAARRRGRTSNAPQPYPYDAGAGRLSATLREAGAGIEADAKARRTVAAWLPTRDSAAIPSGPLIAELPESPAKPELAPWRIEALALGPQQAVELLCACADRPTLAPGVAVGRDLAFWAQALRLAGALVARHQYLPDIEEQDGSYRACWRPVFAAADADRLAEFARTMPPVARAVAEVEAASSRLNTRQDAASTAAAEVEAASSRLNTRQDAASTAAAAPETPAAEALRTFVSAMVDHLIRSATGEAVPPAPPRRGRPKKAPAFDSLHDQWLHALRTPDGLMAGDERELAQFAAQVREWRRPISVSAAAPFRLCFRLEEPAREGEAPAVGAPLCGRPGRPRRAAPTGASASPWHVRFLLQAADDPSLLVPVREAWKARGDAAATLRREGFNVQEHLLASLGQAAGVCPRIEASLKTAAPAGYDLDATGAHEFLTARSIALEQAGFGVMLPAWWTRKGTKLRLTVRANVKSPKMRAGIGISLAEIVQVDWAVALGGETLTLEELEALAKLKAPLVQVRGQWVEMSAAEIEAALDFWRRKASGTAIVRDVVQMALGATRTPGGLALEGVTADGWVGDLLGRLEGTAVFEELGAPGGFVGELRPYQVRGYSWLAFLRQWGLGACLADDMGLGKTIQTLALIERDWEARGRRPVLLVCPMSVVGNWQKEAGRFTPGLPVMVHHGIERKRGAEFEEAAREQAIVISSYALLHRDIEHLRAVNWAGIVLDEAQNIKNPETKQARAARSLAADYRVALTGTPVENNVGDLWSILEFLNPGFLGTQAEFKRGFFIPIQANRDPEAAERLKRLTGPFILRRLKTDKSVIADLPEKLEMKVFCTLTREQASLYAAVVKDAEGTLGAAEGIQRKGVILATLSKLKQVCNHPVQFLGDNSAIPGRSGKLARLTEMLEEILSVGDRALVFSQFSEMGELLRRHLQETFGREVLFLHGAVPKRQRDQMVERFQADGDGPPVFLLSLKAGGTGLNLTRASHVFHFDRWWNPAVENQATDRAFRIGQTRNVQVHKFLCAGTLEEKIDEMIERKKEVAEKVVGTGEGWLTELSNDELKGLFALREEAIGE